MSANGGRLRLNDGLRVASVGLRARPLRAALSALGIAIGTAAIVAILGLSSSSQAGLLAEIDRLGTNMLTAEAGQSLTGQDAQLPLEAPARIVVGGDEHFAAGLRASHHAPGMCAVDGYFFATLQTDIGDETLLAADQRSFDKRLLETHFRPSNTCAARVFAAAGRT